MEQFTLRDFSGGLNTAMDESNLPANMTASLLNVDFLDSKAISRRSGYSRITATPLAAHPVSALYRYYKRGGARYWLGVCGTALYSQQYVSNTQVPLTRLEAESATITGTHIDRTVHAFSGGIGVSASNTVTLAVPYSTSLAMRWHSPVQASLKMDTGSWVTASAGTYTWGGLAASSHTISVKPKAINAKSAKFYVPVSGERYVSAYRTTGLTNTGHVRVRFYDNAAAMPAGVNVGISLHASPSGAGFGLWLDPSGYYRVATITDGDWDTITFASYAFHARTGGWHTLDFFSGGNSTSLVLDGYDLGSYSPARALNYVVAAIYGSALSPGETSLYIDSVMIEPGATVYQEPYVTMTLLDDFSSLSAWTSNVSAGAAFTNDATVYDTTKYTVDLDYVDYSAISTYTKQTGTLTATGDVFAFATLNDSCYITSQFDPIMKFTGASLVTLSASGTTTGAFLVEKGRRLFSAGDATDPALLRYTSLDKGHDWTGGGSIYLAGQDSGGNCTGLTVANGLLYYFSESRTFALDTTGQPANWVAKTLSDSHGCIAPKSVAVAPNAVIFLSADGVRAHGSVQGIFSDDGSAFTILSDNIKPTLAAYTDAEKRAAVGAVYKNHYWLAIGGDVYVCDLEKRTENNQPPWTRYNGHDINCMAVTRADEYGLYAGSRGLTDATKGHIYQLDTGGTDNGAAISMLYKTPPLAPKGYTTVKHLRHLHIAAEASQAQSLDVAVTTDDVSPPEQTVTFTADTDIQPKRLLTPGRGRSATVKLESDGLSQDLTISELTMTYNPKPRVR